LNRAWRRGYTSGVSTKRRSAEPKAASGRRTEFAGTQLGQRTAALPNWCLTALLAAAVALLVVICDWPVLSAQALSVDDNQYLTGNALVQNPSWESTQRFFGEILKPSTVQGYYQPLAMISLMIDYALGGRADNLAAFHRTTLVLHVLNTLLIIVLLYLLFGEPWVAALVGLLFGVHPLTVEPIAWLGERKTMLATFFSLGCLVCHVLYARRATWPRYIGGIAALVLALLSKPTSTPLPILMLLLDYWPLRRLSRRAVVEKVPHYVIAATAVVITIISQGRAGVVTAPTHYSIARLVSLVCHNIVFYLYKAVWPVHVSGNYSVPVPLSPANPAVLAGVIGTCVLLAILLVAWRWTRAPLTGWLFFFVAIFPTLGVIGFTNVIAADKYAYLPAFGLLLILAAALAYLWRTNRRAWSRGLLVAGVLACCGLAAASTRYHLAQWRDSITLYRHVLRVDPNSTTAQYNLGLLLVKRGQNAEAAELFADTLRLNPEQYQAQRELGLALQRLGRTDEALAHYEAALRVNPRFVPALLDLATLLLERGRSDEALTHCQTALQVEPDNYRVHELLGGVLLQRGEYDAAEQHFRREIALLPSRAHGHFSLGIALARQGRPTEAADAFRTALQLDPQHKAARAALDALTRATSKPAQ
jgi:protein O-mannosyl-transferase